MRKNFLIFVGCIIVLLCAYRWGGIHWAAAKTVAVEGLYSGITQFMCPTIKIYDAAAGQLAYEDISGMFIPVLSTIGSSSVGTNGENGFQVGESQKPVLPNSGLEDDESAGDTQKNTQAGGNTENTNIGENTEDTEEKDNAETIENPENTETIVPAIGAEILAGLEKKVVINRQKLQDFDYLRQNFYQVDNSTTVGKDQLNVEALLGKDMTIKSDVEGPQILIYHTHSQEGYKDSIKGDEETSVVAVGEYLASLLEEQFGIEVLHHKGQYDTGDHAKSYSVAKPAIEKILAENPTIEVVIDLHRDGVSENTHLVTEINGKPTAQIMFFNGLSRTTAIGELTYLKNPYIADNLAFSFQMQLAAEEYFPDLTRKIYLKGYRYNMHLCPKSLLVEVGAQTNTLQEAKNAMEPLSILLAKVLKTDKVP